MAGHQGTSTRRDANELLAAISNAERAEINTMVPAEVVAYDQTRQRATIQPRLAMRIGDETVRAPALMEVPYSYPRAGGMVSHTPLKAKDEVVIVVAQRSMDRTGDDASDAENNRGRMNNLSDSIVMAAPHSKPNELKKLPRDSSYTGADDGKNGLTVTQADGSMGGKKVTIGSGTKPDAPTHDLNEQLKGLAARQAQTETAVHGLHQITSKFREIVQQVIPQVAAVAPVLNKLPSGLDAMQADLGGMAQAYLQKQVEQALQKFLSPNLGGLQTLIGGGIEAAIAGAESQLKELLAQNPISDQFDDVLFEIEGLNAETLTDEIQGRLDGLQAQARAMLSANPALSTIMALRSQIEGLAAQAGPALNFLGPQQRLTEGKSKSMRFGGP